MSNIYLYVSQHWVMTMLKISFNIFLSFYFSRKTKLNFSINFSNLSAFMYSLMIHTQYTIHLLFIKRTSMKDSCWIVYFRSCIVHWCWNAFNVDSTWNSQRYFNLMPCFIPQILYFSWFTSDTYLTNHYLTYQLYH